MREETHLYQKQTQIKDSGSRSEFETGAVRDIQEKKGRFDLVPLTIINYIFSNQIELYPYRATWKLAKHFEAGSKKYGDRNWEKGIPTHCFFNSAVRHFYKYMLAIQDEPHLTACAWNLVCLIWTTDQCYMDKLPRDLLTLPHQKLSELENGPIFNAGVEYKKCVLKYLATFLEQGYIDDLEIAFGYCMLLLDVDTKEYEESDES